MATTFTPDQIEAAAYAQYECREANRARRMGVGYFRIPFDGEERRFLLSNAENTLRLEEDQRRGAQLLIDSMAHLSDADIQGWIDRLEAERTTPCYAIIVSSHQYDTTLSELTRYRNEKLRRTLAALSAEHAEGRVGGQFIEPELLQAAE